MYRGFLNLYVALSFGTLVGFTLKYYQDKKYIFSIETTARKKEIEDFILYAFIWLCITSIFWIFEIGMDYLFKNESTKYVFGAIGLVTRYSIKYFLDKKYIFNFNG